MSVAPWIVSAELWERVEPLLPKVERRVRFPGRKRLPDREALQGICLCCTPGSRGGICRSSSGSARARPATRRLEDRWPMLVNRATRLLATVCSSLRRASFTAETPITWSTTKLGVHVDPDSLDAVIARKLQSLDQRLVLRLVVGGRTDRVRDLIHGDQTARSQERTNRRAAQSVPGVAPISVEDVVAARKPASSAASASGVSGSYSGVSPSRTRRTKSERVSPGRRGSDVQTPSATAPDDEQAELVEHASGDRETPRLRNEPHEGLSANVANRGRWPRPVRAAAGRGVRASDPPRTKTPIPHQLLHLGIERPVPGFW
jgi:hypothetical protein